MHRYKFVSTVEDLLDAEESDTTERIGLRKSLRWAVVIICAVMIIAALDALRSLEYSWYPVLGILILGYVIYCFVIASYRRRSKIRRNNPSFEEVAWEFRDDYLEIEASDYGTYRREWQELLDFTDTAKGILLYFNDGVVNWLPNRVFNNREERELFVGFLRSHENQIAEG